MQKGKLIGQGRTAEIFELNKNKIIKLFRSDFPVSAIENEFKIGKELANKELPIPAIDDLIKIDNRFGIIYERISGPTMMRIISSRPWRMKKEAKRLAELHKSIQIHINADIPSQDLKIKKDIKKTELLSFENKARLLDYMETLPKGEILCHGDFHPDNVIVSRNKLFVIDWMSATLGNPLSDVARTSIIFKFGIVPESESKIKSNIIHFMRKKFYSEYMEHYLKVSGQTREMIEQWEVLVSAARLIEWIPVKEKEMLLEFINTHLIQ
jgi:uncharacterized protein (TIGR02172 family)